LGVGKANASVALTISTVAAKDFSNRVNIVMNYLSKNLHYTDAVHCASRM
jgi:hypothetical protein